MYKILGADQQEYGPVGENELREWISEGRANAQSQVQVEGSTEWRALGTFPEFAALLASVAARAPAVLPVMPYSSAASTKTNGMAVAGFICGLLSIPGLCCCCLTPCSILGLIFSCVALSQINRNPMQGGKALAIVGIILSILGLVLWVASFVLGFAGALRDPTFLR
ncbi:MAG TPA: DUF4190 domain-containing protein [Candidatus Cybelea sp.]|jgi:hypothetical protein|nr:DUF4190 domain-containing protein [Candidatus Cybelea sp.]